MLLPEGLVLGFGDEVLKIVVVGGIHQKTTLGAHVELICDDMEYQTVLVTSENFTQPFESHFSDVTDDVVTRCAGAVLLAHGLACDS